MAAKWTQAIARHPVVVWLSVAATLLAVSCWWWLDQRALASRLLVGEPEALMREAALRKDAATLARPVYLKNCAGCHGVPGQPPAKAGVPNLFDSYWLYNSNLVDLEQTIYYGIRSGHPRSRNITDMPALGRIGQLTEAEVADAVQYLLALSQQPADGAAAQRGRAIYLGKGNCFDCHANDARGVSDYGTPALTGGSWLYGGDVNSLHESIFNGRHGKCPAWYGKLSAVQIRALAMWLSAGGTKL